MRERYQVRQFSDTSIHYVWDWKEQRVLYWSIRRWPCDRYVKNLKERC